MDPTGTETPPSYAVRSRRFGCSFGSSLDDDVDVKQSMHNYVAEKPRDDRSIYGKRYKVDTGQLQAATLQLRNLIELHAANYDEWSQGRRCRIRISKHAHH